MNKELYNKFINSKTGDKWQYIDIKRRAGIMVPLFSIYSKDSTGIGDIYDLKILIDWCKKCGFSIIQLLPLNDTGYKFTPYDCVSTFALDPVYINLYNLKITNFDKSISKIKALKGKYKLKDRVNYEIKKEKINLLWEIYNKEEKINEQYEDYVDENDFWLNDYAFFSVLKEKNNQRAWEEWEEKYKQKSYDDLQKFQKENFERINFYRWMQWQLFLQFKAIKQYAKEKGILIFGDLPFLVSRDSADVWANKELFELEFVSGAPPDMYFAKGQRWGMPPYNWGQIEKNNYVYIKERLKYAENFYDMFRIDHFVGLFRIWTIKTTEPENTFGLNGKFDPEDEKVWKSNGRKIINVILEASGMLPCAEDLGVVPQCSYETLDEYGIPGMDVQRWMRDWGKTYEFKKPDEYRINSISLISSHDMTPLITWWEEEAGKVDKFLIRKICEENKFDFEEILNKLFELSGSNEKRLAWKKEIDTPEKVLRILNKTRNEAWMFYDLHKETYDEKEKFLKFLENENLYKEKTTKEFVKIALLKCFQANSIFSIQNIFDILSLGDFFDKINKWDLRINTPGIVSEKNWNLTLPFELEKLFDLDLNDDIVELIKKTERV